MKQMFETLFGKIRDFAAGPLKRFQEFAVTVVLHKAVIPTMLFLTYFIVFGISSVFLRLFARKIFVPARITRDSYWVPAEGYEADLERAKRQS